MASTIPFSTAGMYCRGMAPPTTWSTKLEALAALERLDADRGHAELAVAAGLLLVLALGLGLLVVMVSR